MDKQVSSSMYRQAAFFLVLSIVFSALPLVLALLIDKSNLGLAIGMAWYAVFPPTILLIIAWMLYRNEPNWVSFAGRLSVGVGIWFGVQLLVAALAGLHIVVRLLAFPYTLAGGKGYLLSALLFLLGGLTLRIAGARVAANNPSIPNRTVYAISTIAFLGISILGPLLLIMFTSVPATLPSTGRPESPTQAEVFGYISDIYSFGIRRPGWTPIEQTRDYVVSHLESFGFQNVNVEPTTFDLWKEKSWSLTIGKDAEAWQPETFFFPYSGPTNPEGIEAEIVWVGEPTEENFASVNVTGKIAVVDLPATNITWDQMKMFTFLAYDPDETAKVLSHPYPIAWPTVRAHKLAEEHGAIGLVSILNEYPEIGTFGYYAPYDGELRPMPALYVLDKDGQRLVEQLQTETTSARLVLDAEVSPGGGTAWSVFGILPGKSDDIVMLHSHYDAPWQPAVEDASGTAMVLGLARYYAQMTADEREYTMVFFLGGSHMVGEPSNHAFMETHKDDIMSKLIVDIAIEHIADDFNPGGVSTGLAEPRGTFVFENPVLVSTLVKTVVKHDMYRMLVFPTGTPLGVPTDAGEFSRAGYPVASMIAGPVWLFDNDDTLERVAVEELAPLSAIYIDFIGRLGQISPPLLRFNLNIWTTLVIAILLIPAAVVSAVNKARTNER